MPILIIRTDTYYIFYCYFWPMVYSGKCMWTLCWLVTHMMTLMPFLAIGTWNSWNKTILLYHSSWNCSWMLNYYLQIYTLSKKFLTSRASLIVVFARKGMHLKDTLQHNNICSTRIQMVGFSCNTSCITLIQSSCQR